MQVNPTKKKKQFSSQFFITKVFPFILLYSNALCQLFLFAVIKKELANVQGFLVS